ncbi:MAG: hypothetical protein ABIY55_00630 [Kofleriaceae bacterium]
MIAPFASPRFVTRPHHVVIPPAIPRNRFVAQPPAPPPAPPTLDVPARDPSSVDRRPALELPARSRLVLQRRVVIPPRELVAGRVVTPPHLVTLAPCHQVVS